MQEFHVGHIGESSTVSKPEFEGFALKKGGNTD